MSGLAVAAGVSVLAWLAAAAAVYATRAPADPPVGPTTLDLGPEPPAVANFLVHGFRVTSDAVPATLLDLAAREAIELEQRGPGVYYVRLRRAPAEAVTEYERRVLEHLESLASDGVVPAEALTTGPAQDSSRWRRAFEREVVADASARGLCRDVLGGGVFTVLSVAAVAPAVLVWAAWEITFAAGAWIAAVALLGWIRARHPQRETPAGLAAASRWLGVRAAIAEDEEFKRQTPITVAIWDRHLAYGAALGVASGATAALPMGSESDTHAWSAYGGRWRPVRIRYPSAWPPAWGVDPLVALLAAIVAIVAAALGLYVLGAALLDGGPIANLIFLVPCGVVIIGVAVVVMAWSDLRSPIEVSGPILRLRAFGEEKKRRYFMALDDGAAPVIRAFRVSATQYGELHQGEVVTARLTKNLGCVRWIIRASND